MSLYLNKLGGSKGINFDEIGKEVTNLHLICDHDLITFDYTKTVNYKGTLPDNVKSLTIVSEHRHIHLKGKRLITPFLEELILKGYFHEDDLKRLYEEIYSSNLKVIGLFLFTPKSERHTSPPLDVRHLPNTIEKIETFSQTLNITAKNT